MLGINSDNRFEFTADDPLMRQVFHEAPKESFAAFMNLLSGIGMSDPSPIKTNPPRLVMRESAVCIKRPMRIIYAVPFIIESKEGLGHIHRELVVSLFPGWFWAEKATSSCKGLGLFTYRYDVCSRGWFLRGSEYQGASYQTGGYCTLFGV